MAASEATKKSLSFNKKSLIKNSMTNTIAIFLFRNFECYYLFITNPHVNKSYLCNLANYNTLFTTESKNP